MKKTLAQMYNEVELCGYYPQTNSFGIGFIALSQEDDFRYRTDDYYVVCSIGDNKT